jgi:hypothetical protein
MNVDPQLLDVLGELADLLRSSGERAKATWLDDKRAALVAAENHEAVMNELHAATHGMGSLTDLDLRPAPDAVDAPTDANERLGVLTDELYRLTKR